MVEPTIEKRDNRQRDTNERGEDQKKVRDRGSSPSQSGEQRQEERQI